MEVVKLCNKLESMGFDFHQPEHCKKGDFFVCVDVYPYLVEYGVNDSLWFTTWKSFISFYNKFK
jgi:hypothetical protein